MEKTRELITMQELVSKFDGKYAEIEALDHCGVSIDLRRVVIKKEDDELYFFPTDFENRSTGLICIAEDAIESIVEEEEGSYVMNFCLEMTSVSICEDTISGQLEKAFAEKKKNLQK